VLLIARLANYELSGRMRREKWRRLASMLLGRSFSTGLTGCAATVPVEATHRPTEYRASGLTWPASDRPFHSTRHTGYLAMTRLRITSCGHVFTAETHPDAPQTVAAFLKLLPYRQKIIHVRWSGEGCWVPLGDFKLENDGAAVGFENHTSHPSVGDILFYPGGYSETEIILAYGSCCFASKLGQLAGNHFLTIVEGKEKLRELGTKVLWEGAQEVLFEKI
jgi:hypothetical protein